jgi:hypothetical protein
MKERDLSETIGRVATLLEYAIDEQDWAEVSRALKILDSLYDRMIDDGLLDDE